MKILIATGATKEYIDAIRFISNDSSGKIGIALLREAVKRKHEVKFVYGSGKALNERAIKKISNTEGVEKVINALTYNDFKEAILREVFDCEIFICSAAISDFTVSFPKNFKNFKIKSNSEILLRLKPTEKIVKLVKERFPKIFVVAFKAEYNLSTEGLKNAAIEKLNKEILDMIVANDVAKSKFGENKAEVFLIRKIETHNEILHVKGSKRVIAKKIFDFINNRVVV